MSETPEVDAAARHARREERLRGAGTLIGRTISVVMIVAGLAIFAGTLARGPSWTSVALSSLFLGMALRGLLSLLDFRRRSARVSVPLAYCTAAVFAVSSIANLGALLAESMIPAVLLAPASLVIAGLHVALARAFSSEPAPGRC